MCFSNPFITVGKQQIMARAVLPSWPDLTPFEKKKQHSNAYKLDIFPCKATKASICHAWFTQGSNIAIFANVGLQGELPFS